jgi:hypothetical protein
MAELPLPLTNTVLNLQQRLLSIINRATTTGFTIVEQYGETEATIIALDQLQNVREKATTYYSRFYTLLLRIAESYPVAPNAMLDLLTRSIDEAQAIIDAAEGTIQEAKRDWNLL